MHVDVILVVAREDLGNEPAIRQIALGIRYLVRQVQRLEPDLQLSGQLVGLGLLGGSGAKSGHV